MRKELPMMMKPATKTTSARRLPWSALPKMLRDNKAVPVRFPLPLYHTTVAIPVSGQEEGWSARVLLLDRSGGQVEVFAPLVHYMVANDYLCAPWQNSLARGVGLFWDYCQAHATNGPGTSGFDGELFDAFIRALLRGTIRQGKDESGLFWSSTSRAQAKLIVSRVQKFSEWCEAKGFADAVLGAPKSPGESEVDRRHSVVWTRLQKVGAFAHLHKATPVKFRDQLVPGKEPKGARVQPAKAFPRDKVEDLLKIGHRRPGAPAGGQQHEVYNIRDQMMAILDGWGGLRKSEGLHLWLDDVTLDQRTGMASVKLAHPVESKTPYWQDGRTVMITRKELLNRKYQLQPRNLVLRGRYHVGWKGMDLDSELEERVHWRDHAKGVEFYELYWIYVNRIRKRMMEERRSNRGYDHPFLFVSEVHSDSDGGGIGAPYSSQAYERNHARAVARLGLEHRKNLGTTTHGLRHLYGRDLMRRNLPPQYIKQGLHHRTYLAQAPYTVLDWSEVNDVIVNGWATVLDKNRIPVRHGSPASQRLGEMADEAREGSHDG